jgi:cytochrome P450
MPPEQKLNPYPMYAMMRASQPVFYVEPLGIWTVYRYDDVKSVLSDYGRFSSQIMGVERSLITSDPPRHTKLRGLINKAFTPAKVAAMEPRIRELTAELLDQATAAGTGTLDVVRDLAYPLPVIVIAELLGIPAAERDRFKHWSDAVVESADNAVMQGAAGSGDQEWAEMAAYFRDVIAERRQSPGTDLISGLLDAELDGDRLSETDLLNFCWLLLVAGNETTTNLIGNAVMTLLEFPDQLARLRQDPSLLPSAIEEALRYRSPVQSMFRCAKEQVEVGGTTLPAGSRVVAFIGSANRDPERFPEPDRFDITRDPNPHIAFGHGVHFCLGAPLARLEARVALGALLERFARIEPAWGKLEPARGFIVHGVTSLPVRTGA